MKDINGDKLTFDKFLLFISPDQKTYNCYTTCLKFFIVKGEKILAHKSYVLQALIYIGTVWHLLTNKYHILLFNICDILNTFVWKWGPEFFLQCHFIITKKIQMFCNIIVFKNKPSTFIVRAHTKRVHDHVPIRWHRNNTWSFEIPIKIAFALDFPLRSFKDLYP